MRSLILAAFMAAFSVSAAQAVVVTRQVVVTDGFIGDLFPEIPLTPGVDLDGVRVDFVLSDGRKALFEVGAPVGGIATNMGSGFLRFGLAQVGGNYRTDINFSLIGPNRGTVFSETLSDTTIAAFSSGVGVSVDPGLIFSSVNIDFSPTLLDIGKRAVSGAGEPSISYFLTNVSVSGVAPTVPIPATGLLLLSSLALAAGVRRLT